MKRKTLSILSLFLLLGLCACTSNSHSANSSDNKPSETTSNDNSTTSNSQNTDYEGNLKLNKIGGDFESCFAEWEIVSGATKYEMYYKTSTGSNYTKIDDMLIRHYKDYVRGDILGLEKGTYSIKVVALSDDQELATSTFTIEVKAHVREGYAFVNGSASGAYNDNGTLKNNAVVVYVTKHNASNVEATIDGVKYQGLQAILESKQKTASATPLNIRIIGTLEASDIDYFGSSDQGIQIKGKKAFQDMNLTLEGVGNDATIKGFGILIRNSKNVEIRNIASMNCMDDGISIDTDNSHLWIHNNDFFYGQDKGGDKEKGDGALDTKKSTYITHSFNHFWDSGKCNLQGMKEETPDNYITYHHNWFDHSDSRHPRVRTCTVHVYNNYYDGNSKYGIGATMGASIFVEANYFRNCKKPMLISQQGTDVKNGTGTFSGEEGGMIKAFNNYMNAMSSSTFIPYSETNNEQFDAYVVNERNQEVPNTVKAYLGGTTYSNFDTKDNMYSYDVETPELAKDTVTKYAGRVEGGDFKWTFSDSEDTNYDVIPALREAIENYSSSLVKIQGENFAYDSEKDNSLLPIETALNHNFTTDGLKSNYFKFVGSLSDSKGSITYEGLTLSTALKMESSTEITFSLAKEMTITLVFNGDYNASNGIRIDDKKYAVSNGLFTISLASGTHKITKGDSSNLYYISLK